MGDDVYIERFQHAVFMSNYTMAYTWPITRPTCRLYKGTEVQSEAVIIHEGGVPNREAMDQMTQSKYQNETHNKRPM